MKPKKDDMQGNIAHQAIVWGGGFLVSCLFAWGLSAIFLDSVVPMVWDAALGRFISRPGVVERTRSEGWASTYWGEHGVVGIKDISRDVRSKVFIWGNSHVEALGVGDERKIAQQLTRMLQNEGMDMMGVGLGFSGESVADMYSFMQAYERIASPVAGHVVVLLGMKYVLPDEFSACHSVFTRLPEPRIEKNICTPSDTARAWAPVLYETNANVVIELYKKARGLSLRFAPGPVQKRSSTESAPRSVTAEGYVESWRFMLRALKKQTAVPISFIYCPRIPKISDNRVDLNDAEQPFVRAFATTCAEEGVPFIDVSAQVRNEYMQHARFTRGFFNTIPGQGHINEYGQAIIAKALFERLSEAKSALFAN